MLLPWRPHARQRDIRSSHLPSLSLVGIVPHSRRNRSAEAGGSAGIDFAVAIQGGMRDDAPAGRRYGRHRDPRGEACAHIFLKRPEGRDPLLPRPGKGGSTEGRDGWSGGREAPPSSEPRQSRPSPPPATPTCPADRECLAGSALRGPILAFPATAFKHLCRVGSVSAPLWGRGTTRRVVEGVESCVGLERPRFLGSRKSRGQAAGKMIVRSPPSHHASHGPPPPERAETLTTRHIMSRHMWIR